MNILLSKEKIKVFNEFVEFYNYYYMTEYSFSKKEEITDETDEKTDETDKKTDKIEKSFFILMNPIIYLISFILF